MSRRWIFVLLLLMGAPILDASAQRADRAQRLDRMDRIQDRIAARDRIADRTITDRALDREVVAREIDAEPIEAIEGARDAEVSSDEIVIVLNTFGDRMRRGEVLALNPSDAARAEFSRRNMQPVRQRVISGGAELILYRSAGLLNVTDTLDALRRIDPDGLFAPNHVFAPNGPQGAADLSDVMSTPLPTGTACTIGLIDGPVTGLPETQQANIALSERFHDGAVSTSRHGAAVAHRLFNMAALNAPSRVVTLCVADVIEEGPEAAITAESIVAALMWQMAQDVSLINASFAGPDNEIVAWSVRQFVDAGGTLIAAVGNGGPLSRNIYPAAYDGVVGVTAVDASGALYPLASQGAHVDIAARGVDLDFTHLGFDAPVSGTSFAAPVVSGWLAVNQIALAQAGPALIDHGPPGRDTQFGLGELRDRDAPIIQLAAEHP